MVTISQPDFNSNPLLLFIYVNVFAPEIDPTLQVNYISVRNKTKIDIKKLSLVLPLSLKAFLPPTPLHQT